MSITSIFGTYFFLKYMEQRKIKFHINYDESYKCLIKGKYYIIFNINIINDNDFDLNNLKLCSFLEYLLVDNIKGDIKSTNNYGPGPVFVPSPQKLFPNSIGNKPFHIPKRDCITKDLIFHISTNDDTISKLILIYQLKEIKL